MAGSLESSILILAGLDHLDQLEPKHINHRLKGKPAGNSAQAYPRIRPRSLLSESTIPEDWKEDWELAKASSW
jgi:hypothetical protein